MSLSVACTSSKLSSIYVWLILLLGASMNEQYNFPISLSFSFPSPFLLSSQPPFLYLWSNILSFTRPQSKCRLVLLSSLHRRKLRRVRLSTTECSGDCVSYRLRRVLLSSPQVISQAHPIFSFQLSNQCSYDPQSPIQSLIPVARLDFRFPRRRRQRFDDDCISESVDHHVSWGLNRRL